MRYAKRYVHLTRVVVGGRALDEAIPAAPATSGSRCRTCWGSHGCDRRARHRGDHQCYQCMRVGRDGVDENGFRWQLSE